MRDQLLKLAGAGHEIGFAIDFNQHAGFAVGGELRADQALFRAAGGLLGGAGQAALAQNDLRLGHVAFGFY